jgi:proteic killer suppression protein
MVSGKSKKIPPDLITSALRKMLMLDSAHKIEDLKYPPNNHLEYLIGDRKDQFSIRINGQCALMF